MADYWAQTIPKYLRFLEIKIFLYPGYGRSDSGFSYGFHDPDSSLLAMPLEFLCEDRVFAGKVVSQGQEVIPSCFLCLSLSLYCFPVAFDIFG